MPFQPEIYESLVEKLFDDRLTDEELQQLNHVLRQSPDAREHYWHLVMLEGYLADLPGWIAGQQYATKLAFSETLEAFIEMESNAEVELQTYPPVAKPLTEKQQITWRDVRTVGVFCIRSLAQQKATWGVLAAAIFCIAALVYATWFWPSPSQPPSSPVTQRNQQPAPAAPLPAEPTTVAKVLHHINNAEDTSINVLSSGTMLAQGQAIALQAGSTMELEYRSGASVILQGPGAYELLSPERIGMQQGRITALVPPQAKGFTVSTEQTDFIDHGTEFALTLDEAGYGEVVVFDGLIEARQASAQTNQAAEQAERLMLPEGVGGRLVPDEILPQTVQAIDQFQTDRYARNWDDVVYRPQLSGEITYTPSPPASLEQDQARSTNPLLIPERRGVILAEDLHLNSNKANRSIIQQLGTQVDPLEDYIVPAGAELNSFLIHFERPDKGSQSLLEREFKLQFKGRIVAIVEVLEYQLMTDEYFGLESIRYPKDNALRGAADPPGHPNYDVIYVSKDLRTLNVKMRLSGMDQIRVLVENTDALPEDFAGPARSE